MSIPQLGWLNKAFFILGSTSIIAVWYRQKHFVSEIDDIASHMTLVGQEARIQIRYRMPNNDNISLYEQLCEKYKQHSEEQQKKHKNEMDKFMARQTKQKNLDDDFTRRVAAMMAEQDEDGDNMGLPKRKKSYWSMVIATHLWVL